MIHINSVSNAVFTQIASNTSVVGSGFHTAQNEVINSDPNLLPWVGVYIPSVNVVPHHAQSVNPWLVQYNISVYVQEGSKQSSEKAFDRCFRAMQVALAAINGDRTLGGTVDHIVGMEISPYQLDITQDDNLITHVIDITAEVFA